MVLYSRLKTKQSYPLSPCRNCARNGQTNFFIHLNEEFLWIAGFKNSYLFLFHLEVRIISELMINEQIRDKEIRVIGENGEQLGIMSARDAMKLAKEAELDLVKIAPTAKPPVCKIIDYGKYRYELARKEKEAKKKQKTVEIGRAHV